MPLHLTDKADMGLIFDSEIKRYESMGKKVDVNREHWLALCKDAPSIGFAKDGVLFGGAFFFDHEIHLSVLPEFHGRWGSLVRPMWEWLFSIEDPVRVRVEKDNLKCINFGAAQWPLDGEDDTYVYFKLSSAGLGKPRRARKTALPASAPVTETEAA